MAHGSLHVFMLEEGARATACARLTGRRVDRNERMRGETEATVASGERCSIGLSQDKEEGFDRRARRSLA